MCKHVIFMCYEGIAKSFENLKYVKPPNKILQVLCWKCFSQLGGGGGITKSTHLIHIVHMGNLDEIIWFACFNDVLKQCELDLVIIYV